MCNTEGPLFDDKVSEAYAKFRPFYPPNVAEIITSYMRLHGSSGCDIAADVTCGPGQSTFLLCDHFKQVIGIDISEHQIKQANTLCAKFGKSNVRFIVGDAHKMPFESSSIDLLTCAMGWHWLDAEQFYAEVKRVLKPGGCIAIYGHHVQVTDNERVKKVFEVYHQELAESKCIDEQPLHAMSKYDSVELPFWHTKKSEFDISLKLTIEELLGMISSVVWYRKYSKMYPENNLLEKIRANYEQDPCKQDVESFTFPGFIYLGMME